MKSIYTTYSAALLSFINNLGQPIDLAKGGGENFLHFNLNDSKEAGKLLFSTLYSPIGDKVSAGEFIDAVLNFKLKEKIPDILGYKVSIDKEEKNLVFGCQAIPFAKLEPVWEAFDKRENYEIPKIKTRSSTLMRKIVKDICAELKMKCEIADPDSYYEFIIWSQQHEVQGSMASSNSLLSNGEFIQALLDFKKPTVFEDVCEYSIEICENGIKIRGGIISEEEVAMLRNAIEKTKVKENT